MSFQNLKDY